MNNKEIAVDSTMIEKILDTARDLAEQDGYGSIGWTQFMSTDYPYIDKAIGMLQAQGEVPMTAEEREEDESFKRVLREEGK